MARVTIPFDREVNPTQLAAELRAEGFDVQVTAEKSNRFWVNADAGADQAAIAAVVESHAPTVDAGVQAALEQKQDAITPGENIPAPAGAVTDQDDEARTAIGAILDLLVAQGLMEAAE